MNKKAIIAKAKQKAKNLQLLRQGPRYLHVIGRLVGEGLLDVPGLQKNRRKVWLEDMVWVGIHVEPRVLELIPALALKKPSIFMNREFPPDLRAVMNDLRRGREKVSYYGMPIRKLEPWLAEVGRKGAEPSSLRSFRFSRADQELLRSLSAELDLNETQVLREGLKRLRANR